MVSIVRKVQRDAITVAKALRSQPGRNTPNAFIQLSIAQDTTGFLQRRTFGGLTRVKSDGIAKIQRTIPDISGLVWRKFIRLG